MSEAKTIRLEMLYSENGQMTQAVYEVPAACHTIRVDEQWDGDQRLLEVHGITGEGDDQRREMSTLIEKTSGQLS